MPVVAGDQHVVGREAGRAGAELELVCRAVVLVDAETGTIGPASRKRVGVGAALPWAVPMATAGEAWLDLEALMPAPSWFHQAGVAD